MRLALISIVALIAALLTATVAVHAEGLADERYIIIVGASAPASDVVTGANFAASMKAALGVTYASALDSEAYATLTDENVAEKTIVIIDGSSIRLLGSNPSAERYFRQQGFVVETIDTPSRDDLLLDAPADAPDDSSDSAGDDREADDGAGSGDVGSGIVPPAQVQVAADEPEEPRPAPELTVESDDASEAGGVPPALTPRNETVEPQGQGVLVRVWRWFADLF